MCFLCVILLSMVSVSGYPQTETRTPHQSERYRFRPITVDDGLSQNLISCICQDHIGFIWIGTKDGLNLYDGYHFTVFKYEPSDTFSLTDNYITAIYEDPLHRLWIGTFNGGLFYFDRQSKRFTNFSNDPGNTNSLSNNHIKAIAGDLLGNVWIGTNGGGVNRLSCRDGNRLPDKDNVIIVRYDSSEKGFPEDYARISTLFFDQYQQLWVGTQQNIFRYGGAGQPDEFQKIGIELTSGASLEADTTSGDLNTGAQVIFADSKGGIWMGNHRGLFAFNQAKKVFKSYKDFPPMNIMTATSFVNGDKEQIWVGSEGNIFVINTATGNYSHLSNEKDQKLGLQGGWFSCLFADRGGTMWVGSNGHGISLFSPGSVKFVYPDDILAGSHSFLSTVRNISIRTFFERPGDPNTLWIGANEGLFRTDRKRGLITLVPFKDLPGGQIGSVFYITEDEKENLWIASGIGLVRYNPDDGTYKCFKTGLTESEKSWEPRVSYVHCSKGHIWILTPNTIAELDQKKGQFQHFRYNSSPLDGFSEAVFPSMWQDADGNFWIAAKNGLHYFNVQTQKLTGAGPGTGNPGNVLNNEIRAMIPDPSEPGKILWLGTAMSGLCRFDTQTGDLRQFTEKEGLANNIVNGLLSDGKKNLWISTNRGLSRFDIELERFTNYNMADGLQSNEFNRGAYYKSAGGEIFFGGIKGYNCFFPSAIVPEEFMAPVVFTGLQLYDDNHLAVNEKMFDIQESHHLKLSYNQNHFTIDFASLDFASPLSNAFAFSMSRAGDHWVTTGKERSVTLAELTPGKYILKVHGTNSDGVWSNKEATLALTIGRPWWLSFWAYSVYLLILSGILYGLRKYELSRMLLKNQMKIAVIETNKLKELDQLKSRFFANISHEFRTPLTLINGPLERLIEENTDVENHKTFKMMYSNASRLLQLINQLLDLSRIESGEYVLRAQRGDIVAFIGGLAMSFGSLADQKKIMLNMEVSPELENPEFKDHFCFDRDILEKICNNLIYNAFKYTPDNGRITVSLSKVNNYPQEDFLELIVEDTGVGIPEDKLLFIFNRFYQADKSGFNNHEGTGIGLAYVNELVKVHKGEISVSSVAGSGTTFRVRFSAGESLLSADLITDEMNFHEAQIQPVKHKMDADRVFQSRATYSKDLEKPCVLIVEDHVQVRNYIVDCIQKEYRVMQAPGALEGFSMAEEFIPDLIISDVMMPGMDGYKFCEKIKTSVVTSHIPVILLTARGDIGDRLTGLKTGADDYLTKPFNINELLARIRNLIENRRVLRQKFSSNSIIKPGEISVTPYDVSFMEMLLAVVEKNIGDIRFSVEALAKEAGMSQSQLHRKLKAIINMPANHFIRSVRMQHAMELLQNGAGNISEIAYMVGYDEPGYFSKSFLKFFGKLPSEVNRK